MQAAPQDPSSTIPQCLWGQQCDKTRSWREGWVNVASNEDDFR